MVSPLYGEVPLADKRRWRTANGLGRGGPQPPTWSRRCAEQGSGGPQLPLRAVRDSLSVVCALARLRAAGSLRSLVPAVPARLRRAKLNTRVEGLPDAQQEIELEARLLRPERRVCLDLDHVAVHPLDPTLASSEEVDQFVRQRGVAE